MAEKYIRYFHNTETGKHGDYVGILISPGYGSGWSTWNTQYPEILYDRRLVSLFAAHEVFGVPMDWTTFEMLVKEYYPNAYLGGMKDLQLRWVEEGALFRVNEYDGSESIEYLNIDDWIQL